MATSNMTANVTFRVEEPTHGGWFCFDVVVNSYGIEQRYTDLMWNGSRRSRAWHWIARPFRRWLP